MKTYRLQVTAKDHGMGLLSFLRDKCKGQQLSVKALKRAIDGKQCSVNGRVQFFSTHTLSTGDRIELRLSEEKRNPSSLQTLFEDDYLLICNKPAGLVCTPDINRYSLVHRLDKETSGVLIFAKESLVEEKMAALFAKRQMKKQYLAIVDGQLQDEGKLDHFLVPKTSFDGAVLYGLSKKKNGKRAITFWKCLERGADASLVSIEPITGRTHQIRVQFEVLGHPVLGDWHYAAQFQCSYRPVRHLLHSYQIQFVHPITGKNMDVIAPLPQDFLEAKTALNL
ncbi:MAG TPA: RluA family pseudouridine synthase [Rhabdochlamydiaceae bacterium]|nr:RluA family pseudouridine synthase [Rhabdochlamydiaceae bacterium]